MGCTGSKKNVGIVDPKPEHKQHLLFLGPPGVGKGTQAVEFSKKHGLMHLSTGEMLRAEVAAGTELGKQAKAVMDAGNLVDDKIVLGIVRSCMEKHTGGWILDGFPRTVEQADKLSEMLTEMHQKMDLVVCMVQEDDILIKRGLARGRADDTEEVLKNRLEVYRKNT